MRVGVKFSRIGASKFVSHLDMQRLFSRALRRAGLPAHYSQGFNPHIIMSFAQAMAVGLETEGDYMEFAAEDSMELAAAQAALNAALPEGIRALEMGVLAPGGKKLMAAVEGAQYAIFPLADTPAILDAMGMMLEKTSYIARKTKKNTVKEIDIRPLILNARINDCIIEVETSLKGEASLSPFLLAGELAVMAGCAFHGRILRRELLTTEDGAARPLSTLFMCDPGKKA